MSRIISAEQLKRCRHIDTPVIVGASGDNGKTELIERIEDIEKQAYKEGFEHGRAEGRVAGANEIKQSLAPFTEAFGKVVDEEVEKELVKLALAVAGQIVRREIKSSPDQIIAVMREAIAALPTVVPNTRIYLHPDDATEVRQANLFGEGEQGYQVCDDPSLNRGGCRVATDSSQVDATLETRISSIAAQLLGGERDGDSGGD